MKFFTTREQSKQLLAAGLGRGTADMYFEQLKPNEYNFTPCFGRGMCGDIPCWTVNALLNLLPSPINKIYVLTIEKYEGYEGLEYDIQYSMDEGSGDTLFETSNQSLFEAVYDTVVWWLKYQKEKQHS